MAFLEVTDLEVEFTTRDGVVGAVNGVSFSVNEGETLALVGESGSGKSQTVFALMGLLANNGHARGSVRFDGEEILGIPSARLNSIRAEKIAMIFQDPMTSLNPCLRIAEQMSEVLIYHRGLTKAAAIRESVAMLDAVKIPLSASRIRMYPHELSGGMRQRVMIAMSLLCQPKLLIADEPSTALDVTVQAQIMGMLGEIQREFGTAIILITHDLGVVAGNSDQTLVLYAGRVMEFAATEDLFAAPTHPYTRGLLSAVPRLDHQGGVLATIPGNPPNMMNLPAGCPFCDRCTAAEEICRTHMPALSALEGHPGHQRACNIPTSNLAAQIKFPPDKGG